jgi:hypothetical protein
MELGERRECTLLIISSGFSKGKVGIFAQLLLAKSMCKLIIINDISKFKDFFPLARSQ